MGKKVAEKNKWKGIKWRSFVEYFIAKRENRSMAGVEARERKWIEGKREEGEEVREKE